MFKSLFMCDYLITFYKFIDCIPPLLAQFGISKLENKSIFWSSAFVNLQILGLDCEMTVFQNQVSNVFRLNSHFNNVWVVFPFISEVPIGKQKYFSPSVSADKYHAGFLFREVLHFDSWHVVVQVKWCFVFVLLLSLRNAIQTTSNLVSFQLIWKRVLLLKGLFHLFLVGENRRLLPIFEFGCSLRSCMFSLRFMYLVHLVFNHGSERTSWCVLSHPRVVPLAKLLVITYIRNSLILLRPTVGLIGE